MSDFVKSQEYSDKDALASGDPEKLILGTDFDVELDAIAVAIATKYDSNDIASQAQAEAQSSNAVLLTPLRLANWADYGAGLVTDLRNLTDPNADRLAFWDDSAGALAWLTPGTGVTISGTTISVSATALAITDLIGYDANKYVDHTTVSITAGVGLSGGGTIAATRTLDVDVTELTELVTVDPAADFLLIYDASATTHKKVLVENMVGEELGDSKHKLASGQSLSADTEAPVQFNTDVYDSLTRGTFDTGTYTYTATVDCRVLVIVNLTLDDVNAGADAYVSIQKNSADVARARTRNDADGSTFDLHLTCSTVVSLSATDTIRILGYCSSAETILSTESLSYLCFVELA